MGTIQLGPFVISLWLVLLTIAMFSSLAVGRWTARPWKVDIEPILWTLLIAALIGARIVFVARYFDGYKIAPVSVVDIRDGEFSKTAGAIPLIALVAWFVWRRKEARKPLILAVSTGIVNWYLGMAAMAGRDTGQVRLPQVELARLDGGTVQLHFFVGKPMVVNLWASWCPPCWHEMPVLRDAQAQYRDIVFVFAGSLHWRSVKSWRF